MEKKAIDYTMKVRSVNGGAPFGDPSSVFTFQAEIKALLDDGWDVLSSQSIGLDTGGGQGGAGNIMVFVSLVKYGYFEPVKENVESLETEKSIDA